MMHECSTQGHRWISFTLKRPLMLRSPSPGDAGERGHAAKFLFAGSTVMLCSECLREERFDRHIQAELGFPKGIEKTQSGRMN